MSISPDLLFETALQVHLFLTSHHFRHLFLGGFQLYLLGIHDRQTKDVDVEVEKPFIKGYEKIRDAFKSDPRFGVMEGLRQDGLRIIFFPTQVGVDVLMRQNRLPKKGILLPSPLPRHQHQYPTPSIPCFPVQALLIEKIKSCGERRKLVDARDVLTLSQSPLFVSSLDWNKLHRKLTKSELEKAVDHHPTLQPLLGMLIVG